MSLILSGTNGLSDVDGTAATPAIRGTDANTGIFFPAADQLAASVNGVEGLRLTSTGLGIGTSSITDRVTLGSGRTRINTGGLPLYVGNDGSDNALQLVSGTDIKFQSGSGYNVNMRIDSSGNLGLGVTPPAWGVNFRAIQISEVSISANNNNGNAQYATNAFANSSNAFVYKNSSFATLYVQTYGNGQHQWFTAPSGTAGNAITFTQAMTLDASGNLLIGKTSATIVVNGFQYRNDIQSAAITTSSNQSCLALVRTNTSSDLISFFYSTGLTGVGSITTNGTGTTFNTTSDYRLKTVIGPVADAGQRIDALQPVEYTWNASGERTRGFLAHQFQEVYAGSVTGTKDAVDAEGKPVYQSMQASTSEVIADLVAELKSLRARVAQLEAK